MAPELKHCWANSAGGCSTKLSAEHLVSRSIFPNQPITVRGFSWCKHVPKTIGISTLTGRLLCTKHNSALSIVDTEGAKAFGYFRECTRLSNVRGKRPHKIWNTARHCIDGFLFERWFLKTAINLAITMKGEGLSWAASDSPINRPPLLLVEAAFGTRGLQYPMGLYSAATPGQRESSTDLIQFAPLIHEETKTLSGAIFAFRGYRFLLYVGEKELPMDRFDLPNQELAEWRCSVLRWRLERIKFTLGNRVSHSIDYNWPPLKRPDLAFPIQEFCPTYEYCDLTMSNAQTFLGIIPSIVNGAHLPVDC